MSDNRMIPGAAPDLPSDHLAVAALLGNMAGRPPIMYEAGHGVMANEGGEPLCVCGWDPAREFPFELRRTQVDALRRVNEHLVPRG